MVFPLPLYISLSNHLSPYSLCSVFLQCTVEKNGGALSAHLSGSLEDDPGLRMSISGDLVNSMSTLTALPNISSLVGVLTISGGQTEGKYVINVCTNVCCKDSFQKYMQYCVCI